MGLVTWPWGLSYDFSWKCTDSEYDRWVLTCTINWHMEGHNFTGVLRHQYANSGDLSNERRWLEVSTSYGFPNGDFDVRIFVDGSDTPDGGYPADSLAQIGDSILKARNEA